jgi:decaprenyl-phosphate phosphoribosyltransferase
VLRTVEVAPSRRLRRAVIGFFRTARPRQWLKNLLVFAAPAAGGVLDQRDVLVNAVVMFIAFSLGASGLYFVNDAVDVESDRLHPRKSQRPIASGVIGVQTGLLTGVVLCVLGGLIALLAVSPRAAGVLAIYLVLSLSYSFWLKHEAVLDIALVASGFLLRAIAGGVATDVELSRWFLLSVSFGSLFVVTGKRLAEFLKLGEDRSAHRRTLGTYTEASLRLIVGLAATSMVLTYCLWAFEDASRGEHPVLHQLTIAPFLIASLRYLVDVSAGEAGEPEEALLGDPVVLVAGATWVFLYLWAVYLT